MSEQAHLLTQFLVELEHPISPERLARYRQFGGNDAEAVVSYFWNVNLSEALYPILHAFEVGLRNTIHHAASTVYASEYWFDRPGLLIRWQPGEIERVRNHLAWQRKPQNAGRIVAELNLGFWTTLLSGPYEHRMWRPNKFRMLRLAFPHVNPNIRSRKRIFDRCNRIRLLRNRVFHFEPVFDSPTLAKDYADVLEAIDWMSPALRNVISINDRFPNVHRHGRVELANRLAQTFSSNSSH